MNITKGQIEDIIQSVESYTGYACNAWDMVVPDAIVVAVLRRYHEQQGTDIETLRAENARLREIVETQIKLPPLAYIRTKGRFMRQSRVIRALTEHGLKVAEDE